MRKLDAYTVFLVRAGLQWMTDSIIFTTWMVYQIQAAGLTPLQLVLVGTTMEMTILLFEIPTGVVADTFSRRLSIIIGLFIISAAFLLQAFSPAFAVILFGQVLWGLGYTFTSGASDAWIVDELGEARVGQAFLRAGQVGRVLAIPGIILSAVLATIHLALPLLVGGLLYLALAVFLMLFMPETGFKPQPREDRSTFGQMRKTFIDGLRTVRGRPMLLSILAIGLFYGLFSEAWDRLWQAHLIQSIGLPLLPAPVWVAGIDLVLMVVGIAAAEVLRRRLNTERSASLARALFWLTAAMTASLMLYGLTTNLFVALAALLVFATARGLLGPLYGTWSNMNIDSNVRATVLSMQSQTDAIGQTVGGPPLGALGQVWLPLAFLASAGILSPALFLLRRAQRRLGDQPQAESEPLAAG